MMHVRPQGESRLGFNGGLRRALVTYLEFRGWGPIISPDVRVASSRGFYGTSTEIDLSGPERKSVLKAPTIWIADDVRVASKSRT